MVLIREVANSGNMLKNAEIISVLWYNRRVIVGGLEE